MADLSLGTSSSTCDETTMYIERVNAEEGKIEDILLRSQLQFSAVNKPVFDKYLRDDVALSELLQKPENRAEFLKVDGPNIIEELSIELEGLSDKLTRKHQELQERADELGMIQVRKETIENFVESNSVPQPINKGNIDIVERNVRTRLLAEKEQLSKILGAIFRDREDTHKMFAELVNEKEKNKNEGYKQFPEEEKYREMIRLFLTTGLFEVHPDDPLKVRMVDL